MINVCVIIPIDFMQYWMLICSLVYYLISTVDLFLQVLIYFTRILLIIIG